MIFKSEEYLHIDLEVYSTLHSLFLNIDNIQTFFFKPESSIFKNLMRKPTTYYK